MTTFTEGVDPGAAQAPADHGNRLTTAHVRIDADAPGEELEPLWASLGFDELNWTYTPTGARLLRTVAAACAEGFLVRPHNVFVSGPGSSRPHWGSGNVYHEHADGTPFYDFTIVDDAYDAIVGAGHHVLVELGFTPVALLPEAAAELTIVDSPSLDSAYEAGQWAYPPRDNGRWGDLVAALAAHALDRYGAAEVATWRWELWNEPDLAYWRGTHEQFCELYAVTARAVRRVLPDAQVGGPAVTGGPGGRRFLQGFLEFVVDRDLPLDFVSCHTKGSVFSPWRTYGPIGAPAAERQSPSTATMLGEIRAVLRLMADLGPVAALPLLVDECDAGVPAHRGVHDNPNFGFQNTEYYPVFQVNLMKKLLDLNEREVASVQRATTWSFYFEGERYFEGTRAFLTAGGVEKPLLNAYRAFGRLGARRLPAVCDAAWRVEDLGSPDGIPEQVDALASRHDDGAVTVLLYRHVDDQYRTDTVPTEVTVDLAGLPAARYTLEHHRIDATHSNAYTVWRDLGSPQDPTPEQLAELHARQGLELFEPPSGHRPARGRLRLEVGLPLPSVSVLRLSPASD